MPRDGKAVGSLGCLLECRRIFSLQHAQHKLCKLFSAGTDINYISNTSWQHKLHELFLVVETALERYANCTGQEV